MLTLCPTTTSGLNTFKNQSNTVPVQHRHPLIFGVGPGTGAWGWQAQPKSDFPQIRSPKSGFPQDDLQGICREARPGSALPPCAEEEGPGAFLQSVHPHPQKEGQRKQDKATENEIRAAGAGNKDTCPGWGRGKGSKEGGNARGPPAAPEFGGARENLLWTESGEHPLDLGRLCCRNGKDILFSKN